MRISIVAACLGLCALVLAAVVQAQGSPPAGRTDRLPPMTEARRALGQGNNKFSKRDFPGAIEQYNRAIQLDPNLTEAYERRGTTYYLLRQPEKAVKDYTRAIALSPQNSLAHIGRANAQIALGKTSEAIGDLDQAIALNPRSAGAYNNRGILYSEQGDRPRAIEDYTKAIALQPQYSGAIYNRGNARLEMGEHEAALQDFNRAIEIFPSTRAHTSRAKTLAALGKQEESFADFEQALSLCQQNSPGDCPFTYWSRAEVHNQFGYPERALQDLQKAAELFKQRGDQNNARKVEAEIQKFQPQATM